MLSEAERRFRRNLLEWEQENRREYTWRESNRTLYEVFVAEFFLTQTPADNVATVYPTFFLVLHPW
jgi:A/G-specific adenine glycosylase